VANHEKPSSYCTEADNNDVKVSKRKTDGETDRQTDRWTDLYTWETALTTATEDTD